MTRVVKSQDAEPLIPDHEIIAAAQAVVAEWRAKPFSGERLSRAVKALDAVVVRAVTPKYEEGDPDVTR